MYIPELLNSYGLFQRTSNLNREAGFSDDYALLLNRATSAVVSIRRMEFLQKQCFLELDLFDDQIDDLDDRIVFYSESSVEIQNQISPLLSTLRIMQDQLNQILRRKYPHVNLPRSINQTIERINRYNLPTEIKDLLKTYWGSSGSRIRDLRILDQHYSSIVDKVLLQSSPDRRILILFPDNPKEQSKARWTYNQEIDGISELRIGFDELHQLIEDICEYWEYPSRQVTDSVNLYQLGDLRPFRKRTISLWFYKRLIENGDNKTLDLSGLRIGQLEDGRLEFRKLALTANKLNELRKQMGLD
ncbi:hypothetical protein [Phaeocystidibacter luteus]|uniref:Uncharacterized protein n=1 Tax=Phaeocystidibacter luteus TaxID=911197 RepID=A0A6N6RGL5_9FLAO|nr:hypothetical protein [Phaeocystidibacter luteus]KAB2810243.1 hypothetical protein F8C67_06575 [Phaeocystidibacter luteus]